MLSTVNGLVTELRSMGIPISLSEHLDAAEALHHLDLLDRSEVRGALRSTLIKNESHLKAFDLVFSLFFDRAARAPEEEAGREDSRGSAAGAEVGQSGFLAAMSDEEINLVLEDALRSSDTFTMRASAAELVERHAGMQPGRAVAGTFYLFRTMRAVDTEGMIRRLADVGELDDGPAAELYARLAREKAEASLEQFQQEVEAEIRRRLVADRGAEAVAKTLREPLPEDIDFLQASQSQVEALRVVLEPLARKLASRLQTKRRRHARGVLDFRRTIRKSMSTGGVAAEPIFRPRRPAKPQLVLIADISGSVAAFAGFTLHLAFALRTQFAAVRSFVFVDGVDEVTDLFQESDDIAAAAHRINSDASGVWLDGRSDYGNALQSFNENYGSQLSKRTTVIVLGDARTNYHSPRADAVAAMAARAGHVYWLNPEPAVSWDSGDSVMSEYAKHCESVVECRNVRQLRAFVESLD